MDAVSKVFEKFERFLKLQKHGGCLNGQTCLDWHHLPEVKGHYQSSSPLMTKGKAVSSKSETFLLGLPTCLRYRGHHGAAIHPREAHGRNASQLHFCSVLADDSVPLALSHHDLQASLRGAVRRRGKDKSRRTLILRAALSPQPPVAERLEPLPPDWERVNKPSKGD